MTRPADGSPVADAVARPGRRTDLDWLRVIAFGLLILFHVALVYAPWDWHIHSRHTAEWLREAVAITGPWRLTLLFLISGAALRFMSARRNPGQVLRQRVDRLIPPLVFGVLVLVPIQAWVEAMVKVGWSEGLVGWWLWQFAGPGLARIPFNHLWFVLYVAAYSLVAVWLQTRPDVLARIEGAIDHHLRGWRLVVLPALYLFVARQVLFSFFGVTNNLIWDWYNHAVSLAAFVFGYAIAHRAEVWRRIEDARRGGLLFTVVALPLLMAMIAYPGGSAFFGLPRNALFAAYQAGALVAILGYASLWLRNRDGPALRYLTDAVFPCYIAHQTILVAAAFVILPMGLAVWAEAALLVAVTLGGSLATYEIVRRVPAIRPIWGLKPVREPAAVAYRKRRMLLRFGWLGPAVAFVAVFAAMAAYPGFDQATQFLSELGGATSPAPAIFNRGVMLAGLLAALAGVGFALALLTLGAARIPSLLTAGAFVLGGYGLIVSSLYPWPDPRHLAVNFGLGIIAAPALMLWALARVEGVGGLKRFLIVALAVMAALAVITKHLVLPGTVHPGNVGWWERAFALVLVGWSAVAALLLERRLSKKSGGDPQK